MAGRQKKADGAKAPAAGSGKRGPNREGSEGSERKGPSEKGRQAHAGEAQRRRARMEAQMVAWRQSPEALAAATAAAREMHEAIVSFTRVVGFEFAADFLSDWATGIRQSKGRVQRRKTALVPTVTGRHPRNAANDVYWKCQLLNPPVGPHGKPLTISGLARWKAYIDGVSFLAARRHLTRLNAEVKAEKAAGQPFEPLTEDDQPNALLRLAGARARRSET
jgi:hypothetical protein